MKQRILAALLLSIACPLISACGGIEDVQGAEASASFATDVACVKRKLIFSADDLPKLPAAGSAYVWGANATGGEKLLDPPYSKDFISQAKEAHRRKLEVFAYLEGPCGDTGGVDDGERSRCKGIHDAFNKRFAPKTPDTPEARWKPFTMAQLERSGEVGADYCEIDNLENNVTIPLNPLMKEIKGRYDSGKIHCRIVLKNVSVDALESLKQKVAPTPKDADFIAPFHIFEDDDTRQQAALTRAMRDLKGDGAVTIVSLDTNHYGSKLTKNEFTTCPR
jgi:hypothetical protein